MTGEPEVAGEALIASFPSTRPDISNLTPEDLAYIIFTSGSTGTPKGVMVRHRNTTQFLSSCADFFEIGSGMRFAHFSELTFDPSIFDLFYCWQTGGTVIPANRREYRINPALLIEEQRINVLFTVPSVVAAIRDSGHLSDPRLDSVVHLLLTGEAVPAQLVDDWYKNHPRTTIYNMYGTTETAIVSHWYRIPRNPDPRAPIPVGLPLPGMRIRLLDGDRPVTQGEPGESVVCGSQISAGYWANRFQTELAFQPDQDQPDLPLRAYRTGDLLRQDAEGLYYFVGRTDTQVKIRGHRVELAEIESTLLSNESVLEAAVLVELDPTGASERLTAFIKTEPTIRPDTVRKYLLERLPNYMIPSRILRIPGNMPTGFNGKTDREALKRIAAELASTTETGNGD